MQCTAKNYTQIRRNLRHCAVLFFCMTSKERKENRYQRRKQQRINKRISRTQQYNFSQLLDPKTLIQAYHKTRLNVGWKFSVQQFECRLLFNIAELIDKLQKGENVSRGFVCFTRSERGKTRSIKSVHISERVVQRAFCDNVLIPVLKPSLIYDSAASQKGKGVYFARKRLVEHLRKFYTHYGDEGYVLTVDFSKYFDNINHEILYKKLKNYYFDEKTEKYIHYFVDCFGEKSLGLGSQISQIMAVFYLCKIDHYIKDVLHMKYYGRYMDDCYIIAHTKQEIKTVLEHLKRLCLEDDIILNPSKTKIYKVYNYFPYLKGLYKLLPNGKIIRKLHRSKIKREKQKLRKLYKLHAPEKDIAENIVSWKGGLKGFNAYHSLLSIYKYNLKLRGVQK